MGFEETPPFSPQFEQFEIGGLNYVQNSGSYFLYLFGIVFYIIFSWSMNKIAVKYSKYKLAHKIGIMFYMPELGLYYLVTN